MKQKIFLISMRVLSYILVAAIAVGLTMAFGNNKLTQLEKLIKAYYIDEDQLDYDALEDVAASAMIDALPDGWSYYISADQYAAYESNRANSFVGVGITVQAREDGKGLDIVEITAGGGAQKAGLQPGDVLVKVDGQSLEGKQVTDASAMIQGEEGTFVELEVLRGTEIMKFSVERTLIRVQVATYRMLEGDIGYIYIANFHERCAEETIAAVKDLQSQGAKALIFDVRGNGGGYKNEMVKVLDFLLPEGTLFRSVDYKGKEEIDKSDASCVDMPMAVLIDAESYSAAEFFAAALEEYGWAVTVGAPTVGKGHFQVTLRLPDGSAVALSVGKYYTPRGVSLSEAGGLTPKVTAELSQEAAMKLYSGMLPYEEDPQLQAAVAALKK